MEHLVVAIADLADDLELIELYLALACSFSRVSHPLIYFRPELAIYKYL